jgi:hypothetical protein
VYDGQQRLQTLYSVLGHRFNGRILHFDLLFDETKEPSDDTGFLFRDADAAIHPRYVSMVRLSGTRCEVERKVALETEALAVAATDANAATRVRVNISRLWDVFVERNFNSIAYFTVRSQTSREVNEVFRRLNTGGVGLTELELVLSKIKAVQPDYEQGLWALSDKIRKETGGIEFSSAQILQYFHLLVKGTTRVAEARVKDADISAFQDALKDEGDPLVELFKAYFHGLFRINHAAIVPSWLAVLPLAAYLTSLRRVGEDYRVRNMPDRQVLAMHQYFILSQFCDWSTQTMINAFTKQAIEAGTTVESFPLTRVRELAIEKNRTGILKEVQFAGSPLLAAKILMPARAFVFHERKPQIDHIFPLELAGGDDGYKEAVDVLWNFQPVSPDVNNYKRAKHPKEFLSSAQGSKYLHEYDFLPDLQEKVWDDPVAFVALRKQKMLDELQRRYQMILAPPD